MMSLVQRCNEWNSKKKESKCLMILSCLEIQDLKQEFKTKKEKEETKEETFKPNINPLKMKLDESNSPIITTASLGY